MKKATITKADTAGYRITLPNDKSTYYVGAFYEQGVVYKDREAFKTGNGICYIPECGFFDDLGWDENIPDGFEKLLRDNDMSEYVFCDYELNDGAYTRADIERAIRTEIDGYDFSDIFDHDTIQKFVQKLTIDVFENVDWQCPETYLSEIDMEEEFGFFVESLEDKRLTPKLRKELGYE